MKGTPDERLVIFTRYPEIGEVKTRLIPVLGSEEACALHSRLARLTLDRSRKLLRRRDVVLEVWHAGGDERLMRDWLGGDVEYRSQGSGDLGERMARAFASAFDEGARRTVIIGTDCPGITPEIIEEAFDSLKENDFVVGPARDGGYYLIGLSRFMPELFEGIPWGSSRVLEETMHVSEGLGLRNARLAVLSDVDRPEDLGELEGMVEFPKSPPPSRTISVIIPTLNESGSITDTLNAIRGASNVEPIVVDGGSDDGTVEKARSCGARVVRTEPGRARQMNYAARDASGEILLFLHADTVLPKGFDRTVRELMSRPEVSLGAFSFRTDSDRFGMRAIECLANMRSRWFERPYGDQALFVKKEQFLKVGGFPEIPLMEDLEFVAQMRRKGRVVTLEGRAVTSARRWRERGLLRTTFLNQWILLAYGMGVSPQRLARWYRAGGRPGRH